MKLINKQTYNNGVLCLTYSTEDDVVCCKTINVLIKDNKIKNVKIEGGCQGNGVAISNLLKDMDTCEAINKLRGIDCHNKGTSCPDKIAIILEEINNDQN